MEQVAPPLQHQPARHRLSLQVPRYLLVMFFLLLGFAAVSAGTGALGRSAELPSDPFVSFADLFPGQPRSAVVARRLSCLTTANNGMYYDAPIEICSLWPEDGIFSQVAVKVKEDVIQNTLFLLRENTLRIGDLMLMWGQQAVHSYNQGTYFSWDDNYHTASVINHTGRLSFFLPVRKVYIQNAET
jgi:hypothetical protein